MTAMTYDLQSTMVRLRLIRSATTNRDSNKFTIHYGEIKTNLIWLFNFPVFVFTIHYGEIKTSTVGLCRSDTLHLQSTMVRLRQSITG